MAECLHCDINELVRKRIEASDTVDVAMLAAAIVESLVDLIIEVTPQGDHAKVLADTISTFGAVYLEKTGAVEGGEVGLH
jgi:hypothetical protein